MRFYALGFMTGLFACAAIAAAATHNLGGILMFGGLMAMYVVVAVLHREDRS